MNKEEIQNKIDSISADRDALERTRNKLTGDIALLLQLIAESKKPKLGHGDYGLVWDEDETHPSRFFISRHESILWWSRYCGLPSLTPLHHLTKYKYVIFGNIFDLLKEWSEDVEIYKKTGWGCGMLEMRIISKSSAPFKLIEFRIKNESATFTSVEIDEIWHEFGKMNATLKRKQAKE